LIAFWLIWALMTAIGTCVALKTDNTVPFVLLVFGYVGTIVVPLGLFYRNRKQILKVEGESLIICGAGTLPTSRVRIERHNLQAFTLERYESGGDRESAYTLNLLYQRGSWNKRVVLAPFVHPKDKAILLEEIRTFLGQHGFVFEVKNELPT
jgi:hypothetical protein